MRRHPRTILVLIVGTVLAGLTWLELPSGADEQPTTLVGDGKADDTDALQRLIDSGLGNVALPRGTYRITRTVTIDLDKLGFTSISGQGVARVVMAGPGPAFRFVGTHGGTAAPNTVQPDVWDRQRMPIVDGIEIVGAHPEACGIEAQGTMQLTITRLTVRNALHAIHLVERNRNVIISECQLYDNRGVGVYLDGVNLHQINVCNCHISYNAGGGVVARGSEIRNLQIGTCDIEGNMGGPDDEPSANVWLDSRGGSVAEVTIVGCTIQHSHLAKDSANIRFEGTSVPRSATPERRHGHLTIASNVLSDVRVNVEIRNARAVTITGNTMWQGFDRDMLIEGCESIVVSDNVFDRNPRYFLGRNAAALGGVLIKDTRVGRFSGNVVNGSADIPASVHIQNCQWMNITSNTIVGYRHCALKLEDVSDSRVTDTLFGEEHPESERIIVFEGERNVIEGR